MGLDSYGNTKNTLGYLNKKININDHYGIFAVASASVVTSDNQVSSRCDEGAMGPVGFIWTGNAPYRLPMPIKSLSNIKYISPVIDFAPDFYILYGEAQETKLEMMQRTYDSLPLWQQQALDAGFVPPKEYIDAPHIEEGLIPVWPQRCARTLGELFKLIIEWDEVTKEPFNNVEPGALFYKSILEKLNMPVEVREELIEAFPNSHVAMYILGDVNALQRPSGVPNITPLFDEWVTEVMLNHQYRGPIVSM